jgi:hypothetical protein
MASKFLTGIDVASQRILNVASPSASTDATNKAYVDNVAAGLSIKPSVRAATTANITLSGAQTIDGVSVIATNRVLVKNQTTASQNGIYVAAAGAWALASDSANGSLSSGALVLVDEGSVNDNTMWVLTTNDPITVGSTSLTFSPFTVGVTYSAGNGLTLASTTFSVNAGTGIIADGTSTRIDPAYSGLAKRYAADVASGSTSATVTHSLSTTDVTVAVYDKSGSPVFQVWPDIQVTSTSVVTLVFAVAPTTAQYRVVVTA